MPTVVIPFAGAEGKTRLNMPQQIRRALSLAMLGDVVSAAAAVGATHVVTADAEAEAIAAELGAATVADEGGGQGAAVAAALAQLDSGPVLIVNADVPCIRAGDLEALLAATPPGGVAVVEARDGTTNALSLPAPAVFAALYGPGSAARFRAHAGGLGLEAVVAVVPNLADDVDTVDDLERFRRRCGPRTQACLAKLPAELAR